MRRLNGAAFPGSKYLCPAMLVLFLFCLPGAEANEKKQAADQGLPGYHDKGYQESISFVRAHFLGVAKDGKRARYRLEWASPKTALSFKGLLEFLDPSGRRLLGIMIPHDSGIKFAGGKPYTGETAELWTPGDREFLKYAGKNPSKVRMRFSAWHVVFSDGSEFHWPKDAKDKWTPKGSR